MTNNLLKDFLNRIPQDYQDLLSSFLSQTDNIIHLERLAQLENTARKNPTLKIFPEEKSVFNALIKTPVKDVKAVILGQDPYHTPGLAQGLAFSIPENIPTHSKSYPSSLRNMSKALFLDGFEPLPHGNLNSWAEQGILLLNSCLTVSEGEPNSHQSWGWNLLTNAIIEALSLQHPIAWLLWGKFAQKSFSLISLNQPHLILSASHPSGLGVYQTETPFLFKGDVKSCAHFKTTNEWLKKMGKEPIQWSQSIFM
jgi:uracil-DNA glycosylase